MQHKTRRTALCLLLCLLAAPCHSLIRYTVTVPAVGRDLTVSITADTNGRPTLLYQIPTWSPGWYLIQDYARNVAEVTAVDEMKKELPVDRPAPLTWSVTAGTARTVTLTYKVKDTDVVQENGKPKRAHISGPRT